MLLDPDCGYDKWKIVRNFPEFFFGTSPIGKTWKFEKGGVSKGPAVRPSETSSAKFAEIRSGSSKAVCKFFENQEERFPWKPMCAPYLNILHSSKTKFWLGSWERAASRFSTETDVGKG